jgi:predicted DCC family thiol-disulfide oxidoreductase YuxK
MRGDIILYDGVCGLCNRFVAFVWARDRRRCFRFAPLQGGTARAILARHGRDANALDTVIVVVDPDAPSERLLDRSSAGLYVLARLDGVWRSLATLLGWLPRPLLDVAYRVLARNRYGIFGRLDACPVPGPEHRERFIEG